MFAMEEEAVKVNWSFFSLFGPSFAVFVASRDPTIFCAEDAFRSFYPGLFGFVQGLWYGGFHASELTPRRVCKSPPDSS
ncbi:hypothetical protein NPIL_424241 [Nephila pilipes]|uniref:Uncharacterized protein n=1 Tax=Nephila pilipes TaxID=299642 RepID=A0A8X6NX77_NEPPI|nr:hypothetical protein NPIL_424241 [Nephila pilipes]